MTGTSEIRAENLLKELAGVWKDLGKAEEKYAVLRACALTLLIATTGTGDESELAGTLGDLMHTHPGRFITLRLMDSAEPRFEARVFAQCQLAFGRRQQICCEQIEFVATPDRIPDFYAVALGLPVADLPVLLWIKDAKLLFDAHFRAVLPLARPILLDSAQLDDPAAAFAELQALRHAGWRIKDLCWTRLTVWRETIAQMFESTTCRGLYSGLDRIEVSTPADAARPETLYLAAWLAERLPDAALEIRTGAAEAAVRLSGNGNTIELRSSDDTLTASRPDGIVTHVQGVASTDAELLTEELGILGPDPTFDRTLASAEHLARTHSHS